MAKKKRTDKTPRMIQADEDQWDIVRERAWRERVSVSAWVRAAIDERLDDERQRRVARRKRA